MFEQDLVHSDCIVVMGSNMAENHPIAFRFAMQARERGARLIHVDPRFSRTSAMADTHVRIRSGSDIAFLGGLINYVLQNELYFKEYVQHYTNASTLINEDFQDTEDLDGMFSGYDPEKRQYDIDSWSYRGSPLSPHDHEEGAQMQDQVDNKQNAEESIDTAQAQRGSGHAKPPWPPDRDETLQDPKCVFQITRRHFSRYTPEVVSEICGCSVEDFLTVAKAMTENSGPERTSAFCYAMGWTQHTTGVQLIGTAALLQLLLGNMGRPGGGILALRGHATIQGSTDVPTLYNLLPGYLPQPSTIVGHNTLDDYLRLQTPRTGWWHNTPKYMISLLKSWYGDAATAENDYMYDYVPKIDKDYSLLPMMQEMRDGKIIGMFCMGQNPAVGTQDAGMVRKGLAQLEWLVVRDAFEVETATFWKNSPEVKRGELDPKQIKTEIFLMPAAMIAEKGGTFTNTMRLIQYHDKAIEPPDDARSEAWFMYHLGKRLKELYADSTAERDRGIQALTWDYPTEGPYDEPIIDEIDKEINGWTVADRKLVPGFAALKDDGSTACGCWIYSGMYPAEGQNKTKSREGDDWVSLGWGFSWPANRRTLYNRASAAPDGSPWSERKKYVWWDAEQGKWTGYDVPDFPINKAPDTPLDPDGVSIEAHAGSDPFIMMPDGRGWLYVPSGLRDGPLPTHYEPVESPVKNLLYEQSASPVAKIWERKDNRIIKHGDSEYPYVLTTYRLVEHHTGGGMTRFLPWLAELQPTSFVEISTELAAELGIDNGEWVTVFTPRGEAEGRALVTERMKPMRVRRRLVHQIGMPRHYGYEGLAKGGTANNLTSMVADPNVSIHESKALLANIRKGRSSGQA
jgi:formate dehydrogenase major subunit